MTVSVVGLLLGMIAGGPAYGQFSRVWSAREVQAGQPLNLFARWDGRSRLDGVVVEVPAGWEVQEALALRQGYTPVPLQVQVSAEDPRVSVVTAPYTLRGSHDVIVRMATPGTPGYGTWTMTPFLRSAGWTPRRARDAYRVEGTVRRVEPVPVIDNRVLAFEPGAGPWLLRRAAMPDLGTRSAYTLEYWMCTTALDVVVLSTWTGGEREAYPLELVVDPAGRLRYYRGRPGYHESMATQAPVADGQWHHVALVHTPETGWTRLYLDGQATDSLYSAAPLAVPYETPLALGGRVPSRRRTDAAARGYAGQLDEVRLWPYGRSAASIRRTLRQPLAAGDAGAVVLDFEAPPSDALAEAPPPRTARVASNLAFYQPVRNVQARPTGGVVQVTWETDDVHTQAFVVERSYDGEAFDPVGTVPVEASARDADRFTYEDPGVTEEVVFYRIRQRFESGTERVSGAIKLGLGQEAPDGVALVGNFPNPFNPVTTITYAVETAQPVRVSVWDLAGHQVAVLVDEVEPPGQYQVRFEGHDLPSGTYFVRLETPSGRQTHKMVLMK